MDQLDVETPALQILHARGSQFSRFVGGIVQDLDLEQFARVIDLADRLEQALDDVDLVEDRQLHRYLGQLLEMASRRDGSLPVFQEKVDNDVAVDPVSGETDQDGQVADRPDDRAEASLHSGIRETAPKAFGARAT